MNNNKGFSLISVMVAMGVSLLVLSLTTQAILLSTKQSATVRIDTDILGFVNEQRAQLLSVGEEALDASFQGRGWQVSRIDKTTVVNDDTTVTKYSAVIKRNPSSIIGPEWVVREIGSVVVKNAVVPPPAIVDDFDKDLADQIARDSREKNKRDDDCKRR